MDLLKSNYSKPAKPVRELQPLQTGSPLTRQPSNDAVTTTSTAEERQRSFEQARQRQGSLSPQPTSPGLRDSLEHDQALLTQLIDSDSRTTPSKRKLEALEEKDEEETPVARVPLMSPTVSASTNDDDGVIQPAKRQKTKQPEKSDSPALRSLLAAYADSEEEDEEETNLMTVQASKPMVTQPVQSPSAPRSYLPPLPAFITGSSPAVSSSQQPALSDWFSTLGPPVPSRTKSVSRPRPEPQVVTFERFQVLNRSAIGRLPLFQQQQIYTEITTQAGRQFASRDLSQIQPRDQREYLKAIHLDKDLYTGFEDRDPYPEQRASLLQKMSKKQELTGDENLLAHFLKHQGDTHTHSLEAYRTKAQTFLNKPESDSIQYYFTKDAFDKGYQSLVAKFDSDTGEFGTKRASGEMSTYYVKNNHYRGQGLDSSRWSLLTISE